MIKKIGLLLAFIPMALSAQFAPKKGEFFLYDATYDMLLLNNSGYQTNGFGNGHNLSLMGDYVFSKSHYSLGYGLGIGSHNTFSNIYVRSAANGDQVISLVDLDTTTLKKNKINFNYIDIPLEVRYRSGLNKKGRYWRVHLGVRVGIRYSFYSEIEDANHHYKDLNTSQINSLRTVGYLRVGHGFLNAVFQYNFSPLWEINNDVENLNSARMLSMGLSIAL